MATKTYTCNFHEFGFDSLLLAIVKRKPDKLTDYMASTERVDGLVDRAAY